MSVSTVTVWIFSWRNYTEFVIVVALYFLAMRNVEMVSHWFHIFLLLLCQWVPHCIAEKRCPLYVACLSAHSMSLCWKILCWNILCPKTLCWKIICSKILCSKIICLKILCAPSSHTFLLVAFRLDRAIIVVSSIIGTIHTCIISDITIAVIMSVFARAKKCRCIAWNDILPSLIITLAFIPYGDQAMSKGISKGIPLEMVSLVIHYWAPWSRIWLSVVVSDLRYRCHHDTYKDTCST